MLKILFPCIAIVGLFLLIRSVLKLTKTFTANQQEFPATTLQTNLDLPKSGKYEIDIKRPSLAGVISLRSSFQLTNQATGHPVTITQSDNIFAGRKDGSGNRIVPIAHFTVDQPGTYSLENLSPSDFIAGDQLVIMPAVGMKGALAILATVFSGLLFIGGLVLTALAFKGKL